MQYRRRLYNKTMLNPIFNKTSSQKTVWKYIPYELDFNKQTL